MDRVTKSFVNEFSNSFGLNELDNESLLFEHFVNYTIVEPKTEYHFDLDSINIGIDGTIGIDGFVLLLNKSVIGSVAELDEFMDGNKKCSAEVIFIQSKSSTKFETKEINSFGTSVIDFISEDPGLKWSGVAIEKIDLFNKFVGRISELKESPICNLFYVSLGTDEKDQNVYAIVDDIKKKILSENIFSNVNFEIIDKVSLQSKYKKIGQVLERSFEFPNRVTMPVINDVKESYIGIINTKTIVDLMTNDNDEIINNVFYDNVRDYQGENKVNIEIKETLLGGGSDSFSILNNGITIVAEELTTTRDRFTISNYQIINGCQTSHVLYENRDSLTDSIMVPIKIVISDNEQLTSRVIRSTNRQTEVKEQDLIAFSNFQKRLEDYYSTFSEEEKLFYERRSKQFNNKNVEKKRIIDKTTQIKSIASIFYDKPNLATRYFGALFNEFGDELFKDNHDMYPYYIAAFAFYKIESLFRQNKIDRKYKKIKFHLLTLVRHEINPTKCPPFESKRCRKYCEDIADILKDDIKLDACIRSAIEKINSLEGISLDDNELSKSKEFINKLLALYK